ncbi:hypothetical protein [Flavobacterium sp.]|uniref:hypothetical protein n=1 Tax=Flavobacterium sp. TaxID=239 RepID=UPI003F69729B
MKHFFLTILFLFNSSYVFSCVCIPSKLIDKFQKSEFVAKVKILKVTNIGNDLEYQNAEIEVLELYKGKKITTIKILASMNSSCSLYVPENSTWLIFADTFNGVLSFGYCSGSNQLDADMYSKKYPNNQKNYNKANEKKLTALKILKEYKIKNFNENDLKISYKEKPCKNNFLGYEVKNDKIAIYEIKVNRNLKIKKIKAISEFDNADLSRQILKCLSENLIIDKKRIKKIPKKSKIYIIYYYNEEVDKNQSYITDYFLI